MNGTHDQDPEYAPDVAAELDSVGDVPTNVLASRLSWDGICMWVRTIGTEPQWTGNDALDRAMTAPICARCPVQRECLEFEFRSFGHATAGIWGPLDSEDRRAVYLAWVQRRDGGRR